MIKSECTGKIIGDGKKEVTCMITGNTADFAVEYEAIIRIIKDNPELLQVADMVISKLMLEHVSQNVPDCFRPKSDSITEVITNISGNSEDVKTELLTLLCAIHNLNWLYVQEVINDYLKLSRICDGGKITEANIQKFLENKRRKDK